MIDPTASAFRLLVAMMKQDGMVPPPSSGAYKAALRWWDGLPQHERDLWQQLGLEHVRQWWTLAVDWRERTREWQDAHKDEYDLQGVEEQVAGHNDPTFVIEFEHVEYIGGMGSVASWAKNKSFGPITGIRPVEPDDPYDPYKIVVRHKDTSPWFIKWNKRNLLKSVLPKRLVPVVNQSRSMPWGQFNAKCQGGWVPGKITTYDDEVHKLRPIFREAVVAPDKRKIVSVRHIKDGGVCLRYKFWDDSDPRWKAAHKFLHSKYGWSIRDIWEHITGKTLEPAVPLLEEKFQQSLF